MRLRFCIAAIGIIAAVAAAAEAQEEAELSERLIAIGERPLIRMGAGGVDISGFIIGGRVFPFSPCSDYFRFAKVPSLIGSAKHLAQVMDLSLDPGFPTYYVPIYNVRDYQIRIDNSKAVPTAQVMYRNPLRPDIGKILIVIRMSADEYRRSSGLPQPVP